MSWLELWEFYQALPYDSMTRSAQAGDHGHRRWTETEYLLVDLGSRLNIISQILWAGNIKGKPPEFPLYGMPDLRSWEQIEAEIAASTRARRYHEAMKPGNTNTEYAKKLAAAREEHLRRAAEQAEQARTTGETAGPADN
jgi:hypothetical protein